MENEPTRRLTKRANASEFHGLGHRTRSCLPLLVVKPKILPFLVALYSFLANMRSFFGFRNSVLRRSLAFIYVHAQRYRVKRAFIFLGKYVKSFKSPHPWR